MTAPLHPAHLAGQRTSGQSAAAAAAAASARRAAVTAPPRKKATVQKCGAGTAAAQPEAVLPEVVQDATWLFNQRRRPGFLTDDISGGRCVLCCAALHQQLRQACV